MCAKAKKQNIVLNICLLGESFRESILDEAMLKFSFLSDLKNKRIQGI